MKKTIIFLIFLLSISLASASDLVIEHKEVSWFSNLFITQSVTGGAFLGDTETTRGGLLTATPYITFLHDSEHSDYIVYLRQEGKTDLLIDEIHDNYAFREGDKIAITISNIDISNLPDTWCNKYFTLYIKHYSFYNGEYHEETPREGGFSSYKLLDCGELCERKYSGTATDGTILGKFCKNDDVYLKYQTDDCQILESIQERCLDTGCINGECGDPIVCQVGTFGNNFCKENSVYQKSGLGAVNNVCEYEDKLVIECGNDFDCSVGTCIPKEKCGDDSCNNGETKVTCPADCGEPYFCGDGLCNGEENENTCSIDCFVPPSPSQCEVNKDCKELAGIVCEDGNTEYANYECINNVCIIGAGDPCEKGSKTALYAVIGVVVLFIMVFSVIAMFKRK